MIKMKVHVAVFILLFGLTNADDDSCTSNDFKCTDGKRCIGKAFVCDDYPNCLDSSDEEPELCETWEYEYEDTDYGGGGGGGWLGWGGGDYEEEYDDSEGESDPSPVGTEDDSENEIESDSYASNFEDIDDGELVAPQRCSLNKCIPQGPLSLKDDIKYHYSYELVSKTQTIREMENQTSSMVITCDVTIEVLTACEMYIMVENVVSKSSTPKSDGAPTMVDENVEFLRAIEREPLRFSMLGGEIDFVCPSPKEDPKALNFKKGIISMLQNTMPKLHLSHTQIEKDIVGECEMNYQFEGANEERIVVSKTRDIHSCKARSYLASAAQGVPYDFPMETNPLPVVETVSECKQEIKLGVIRDAICTEDHVLTPFNMDHGGIKTTISQKLRFVSDAFSIPSWGPIGRRTDLLFDHHNHFHDDNHEEETQSGNQDETHFVTAVNVILNMIEDSSNSKDSEEEEASPSSLFKHLVTALRQLSVDQLSTVNKDRRWGDTDRQYFHDAIGMVGTASSLSFMAKEIPSVSDASVVRSWINSLSYIQSSDVNIISELISILKAKNVPNEVFLSGGALLNTYCLSHPSCESHEPVMEVLKVFEEVIRSKCGTRGRSPKLQVLMALRGIGNAGLAANDAIIDALNKCILEEDSEPEITATAIEAFRRIPCNVSRSALENIFSDDEKDSELRILSYLGLMRCVNYETLHLVEDIFRNEEVNQVGSFVWTHLTNLQESSTPSKIEVQSLLSNREFEEKFKSDFRKFSKNIEWSGFYDTLNVGASLESNIIFSQKSYVPRQTTFNLTADLFGRSFNFFEAGIRLQGFEKYIERLINGANTEVSNRAIKSKSIRGLIRKSTRREEYLETEPELSFHTKIFGNDFSYEHINTMEKIASKFRDLNPERIMQYLKDGKEFNFKKSFLPLDSSYQLATSSGLPLRIQVEGSATVDVSASFQMDVTAIKKGKGMLKGHLKPSLSVDLRASMVFEGYSSATGVEMDSSLFSSTLIDGKVEVDGSSAVKMDFNLPQDKVEVFKTSAKLALIHGHSKVTDLNPDEQLANREVVSNPNIPFLGSGQCLPFEVMYGFILCYSKTHPDVSKSPFNHKILLNNPVKFKLDLTKTDPSLTSYKFRYQWTNDDDGLRFYLLYDTPGSTIKREHSFNLVINYDKSDGEMSYRSPSLSFDARGNYIWSPDMKRLNVSLHLNGREEGTVIIGYNIHERSGQSILIPIFQVNWRGIQFIKVTGNLEARERDSGEDLIHYGVDLQFEVDTSGTGQKGQRGRGDIDGFISKEKDDWEASLGIVYSFAGSSVTENITIDYKKVMTSNDLSSSVKVVRIWKASFTQFPHLNTKGKWASKAFAGSIENSIQGSFGRDFENPLHQVDFYHNLIFYGGHEQTTFNSTVAIKYPKNELDVVIGADLYHDIRDINAGFKFQYSTGNEMSSRFHLIRSLSGPSKIEGSFYLIVPTWLDLRMKGEFRQTGTQNYEFDFDGSLSASQRLEVTGYYTNLSTRLKYLHKLEMKIKLPSRNVVYSNSTFLYDMFQLAIASQIKTNDGSKYKLRLVYISQIDDFSAHQRKIEVDLNLPGKSYYWHSEITFGKYITVSNDIHIDSSRDINLWVQVHSEQNELNSIQIKFLWDANRDPHKKANFEIVLGDRSVDLIFSLSFLGNEYEAIWRSSKEWVTEENHLKLWNHNHAGEVSWKDNRRVVHEIAFGTSFNLRRGERAELTADVYLTTPLENWKNNSVHIEYSRFADHIVASLNSKWHRDEFLNLNFNVGAEKSENGMKGECKVEVLSLINENLVSLSTGAVLSKSKGMLDGKLFLQWDKDEVQFIFEAVNSSGPKDIRMSMIAKVLTTLPGYDHLSTFVDLYATVGSIVLHASAEWEDILYELKCNGELYSAQEYLKGEIYLTTPQYGSDTASAKIKVYRDAETHDEKLMVIAHWLNEEIKLNGRVSTNPQDFGGELNLEIPFEKLSQVSLSMSHSTSDFYMTEVWLKWNNTKDVGLKIISRMFSLSDFLMSVTIKTPFPKYKEVKGELKNLFQLTPSVRVNSRIFGQLDDKKYGLGGRYEQGELTRLRVGLEIHYPTPNLEEVKFDIADNSDSDNMRYKFELKHGAERQINIDTQFKRLDTFLEFDVVSGITLASFLGSDFEKVNFEGGAKIYWSHATDFEVKLATITPRDTYKIFAKGLIRPDKSGMFEGKFALPFENFEDLGYIVKFQQPSYFENGYLDVKMTTGRLKFLTFDFKGTYKDVSVTFTTPFANFSRGHFEYELVPRDIIRFTITGGASLEDKQITFDGYLYYSNENNYITKAEINAKTPFKGYDQVKLTLEGRPQSGGAEHVVKFQKNETSYEGKIFYEVLANHHWTLRGEVAKNVDGITSSYSAVISYESTDEKPLVFSFKTKGLDLKYEGSVSLIKSQSRTKLYDLSIEWDIRGSSGILTIIVENFENERISGSVILRLLDSEKPDEVYTLKADLSNRSIPDEVDLGLFIEISSTNRQWNYILVDGSLKQVTSEPGLLKVYLVWPEMNPVNFTAMANYKSIPSFDLRTNVNLNLTTANYGFFGEVKRESETLILNGGIWWQKESGSRIRKIKLTSSFELLEENIIGSSVLHLPMVEGFEVSKADIKYRKEQDFKELSVTVEAGGTKTSFNSFLKSTQFPAAEGNATFSSSILKEGHPLTLNFNQALTPDGYKGDYDVGWPVWDMKTRSYGREFVKVVLNHSNLPRGKEGTLQLLLPLTKGKPISLTYSFQFPKKPDVIIKLGIGYEKLKLEVKGSHIVTRTQSQQIKKTSVELDNLIWPFGIAYFETLSLLPSNGNESNDEVIIYDLQDKNRRSSLSFGKKKNSEGGRISMKGIFVEREVEISAGYKTLPRNFGGDVLVSWSQDEKIECQFDWKDKRQSPEETNYLLVGRISHPLRTILMEAIYVRSYGKLTSDLTLNTDLGNPDKMPLKAVVNYENQQLPENQKNITGSVKISHPSLESDIHLIGELQRNYLHPLLFNLLLQYSSASESDLSVKALLKRNEAEQQQFVNLFEVAHYASNLHAKANGMVKYGDSVYSFDQDFVYMNDEGNEYTARLDGGIDLQERTFHTLVESSKRILDLKLKIQEEDEGHWKMQTTSDTHNSFPVTTSLHLHPSQPIFLLTIENLNKGSEGVTRIEDAKYPRYLAEKVVLEGGLQDQRFAHFSIRHLAPSTGAEGNSTQFWTQDVDFGFKLNNSKLVSSRLEWRKRVEEEVTNEVSELMGVTRELKADIREWLKNALITAGGEVVQRSRSILTEVVTAIKPLLHHFKNESKEFKGEFYVLYKSINMTKKERDLKTSIRFVLNNIAKSLNEIEFVKKVKAVLAKGTLRVHIVNLIQKFKDFCASILTKDPSLGKLVEKIKEFASNFASAYDNAAKKWYLIFRNAVGDFKTRLTEWLRNKWHNLYYSYKPHILRTMHHIESTSYILISRLWESMNKLGANFKSLTYIQTLEQIYKKIKSIYEEMAERTLRQNVEWVYRYITSNIKKGIDIFFARVLPFIEDWLNEIEKAWMKFTSYEKVNVVVDFCYNILQTVYWGVNKIDFSEHIMNATAFALEHGYTVMTQRATEAQLRHIVAKTDMTWRPEEGKIRLVQKLPFVWNTFNRMPKLKEMLEIPYISPMKRVLFPSTKFSVLDSWYRYFNLNFDPLTWIPPFPATGYLVGDNYILTFDGQLINYKGSCTHILAVDLVYRRWAVVVKYNKYTPKTVNVYLDGKVIEFSKQFKIKIDSRLAILPLSLDTAFMWRTDGALHLRQKNMMELSWNLIHDVVSIKMPRESFLNTAGLLGTNNNEPIDDLLMPDGTRWHNSKNLKEFVDAWKVTDMSCDSEEEMTSLEEPVTSSLCEDLFVSKTSPFRYCFYQVDPAPYYEICMKSYKGNIKDSSPSALAYRERCKENAVPIKLPVDYVRCEYTNASTDTVKKLQEGQTVTLRKEEVENVVDVVLLIELKKCNRDRLLTKQFHRFIIMFNEGLMKEGVASTRFALVVFGGPGLNWKSHVVSSGTEIFTSPKNVAKALENLDFYTEDLYDTVNADITFTAITYASNLAFRSPANVVFALFPCVPCTEAYGFDYSTMYHILLNNAATLYVFKSHYFDIDKQSIREKLIGYDKENAYTFKDHKKRKMGDTALRNQIYPPKTELNLCLPLAIETNGAVFSSEILLGSKKKVERLGLVSGRRAGQNAKQEYAQRCLCLSTQEVTPLLRCDHWENGDFSVLERYGLNLESMSPFHEDIANEKGEGFYQEDK